MKITMPRCVVVIAAAVLWTTVRYRPLVPET